MKTQASMGRASTNATPSSSSRCCTTSNFLLYLLVTLALALSGLNFWMNLYRHEQLREEVASLDQNINETNHKVQNPQFVELSLKKLNSLLDKSGAKVGNSHHPDSLDDDSIKEGHVKARLIYEEDYHAHIDNVTEGISLALKHDIEKDVKRRMDHLKKQVDDLKKDVNQYSTENEEIRSRHQTHGMILTRLQTGVATFDDERDKIFNAMKNLNKTVFNAIQASKINIDSIQGIRKVIEELKKGQNTEKSKQLAHDGSGMEFSFDANEISEWKILIDNKLVELRNELENTSDNIMDKMFEKDDSFRKKMKEYDNKLILLRNDYNSMQDDIGSMEEDSKDKMDRTENKMRKYSEVIANLNQTLQSEINRLSSEKSKSISGSEYSDYDLGEYGRLSSLLKLYSKKDTIEPLVETVEELKSEVQLLSERGDQLDALEHKSEYDKSRLNETIQILKQKLEYIASGRDTNGEELSIISNLKSQVDNRVRDITDNVIRVESNLEKTDSKLSTVETRMKKYAIKLSRLSRNLTSIQKLSSQIQALK